MNKMSGDNMIASLIADAPQWEPKKVDDSTSIKKPAHEIKPISAPDLLASVFAPTQFPSDYFFSALAELILDE